MPSSPGRPAGLHENLSLFAGLQAGRAMPCAQSMLDLQGSRQSLRSAANPAEIVAMIVRPISGQARRRGPWRRGACRLVTSGDVGMEGTAQWLYDWLDLWIRNATGGRARGASVEAIEDQKNSPIYIADRAGTPRCRLRPPASPCDS